MLQPERRSNAELSGLSTFRLPATARELVFLDHTDQLGELDIKTPLLMLGGGSNTVFLSDWPGTVLVNRLRGKTVERVSAQSSRLRAAGGENWHQLVRWCLDQKLHGLENLILIPGSVGAAPIQNIGAYGAELAEVLESVTAWDWQCKTLREITAADCGFGYRTSRFKTEDRGRFLITAITLRLEHEYRPQTGYESLAKELQRTIRDTTPSARQVAAAVMRVRRHRLPDPARIANVGSFFKNPVVPARQAEQLLAEHSALPHWTMPDGRIKFAAGWLIESLGWKGKTIGQAGVYSNHALVLINRGGATADQVKQLIEEITSDIKQTYGLALEPEPVLVG